MKKIVSKIKAPTAVVEKKSEVPEVIKVAEVAQVAKVA
jgi:hypothetical protein